MAAVVGEQMEDVVADITETVAMLYCLHNGRETFDRDLQIALGRLNGGTYKDLAAEHGISPSTAMIRVGAINPSSSHGGSIRRGLRRYRFLQYIEMNERELFADAWNIDFECLSDMLTNR